MASSSNIDKPSDWVIRFSRSKNGRKYYLNLKTNTSTWEQPACLSGLADTEQQPRQCIRPKQSCGPSNREKSGRVDSENSVTTLVRKPTKVSPGDDPGARKADQSIDKITKILNRIRAARQHEGSSAKVLDKKGNLSRGVSARKKSKSSAGEIKHVSKRTRGLADWTDGELSDTLGAGASKNEDIGSGLELYKVGGNSKGVYKGAGSQSHGMVSKEKVVSKPVRKLENDGLSVCLKKHAELSSLDKVVTVLKTDSGEEKIFKWKGKRKEVTSPYSRRCKVLKKESHVESVTQNLSSHSSNATVTKIRKGVGIGRNRKQENVHLTNEGGNGSRLDDLTRSDSSAKACKTAANEKPLEPSDRRPDGRFVAGNTSYKNPINVAVESTGLMASMFATATRNSSESFTKTGMVCDGAKLLTSTFDSGNDSDRDVDMLDLTVEDGGESDMDYETYSLADSCRTGRVCSAEFGTALFIVCDTSVLIGDLDVVKRLVKGSRQGANLPVLVIPWTVLQELDGLKDSYKSLPEHQELEKRRQVMAPIRFLFHCFRQRHPRVMGQTVVEANIDCADFQVTGNDDRILSCALQWKYKYPDSQVALLTNDINLCTKALVSGLQSYTAQTVEAELLSRLPASTGRQSTTTSPRPSTHQNSSPQIGDTDETVQDVFQNVWSTLNDLCNKMAAVIQEPSVDRKQVLTFFAKLTETAKKLQVDFESILQVGCSQVDIDQHSGRFFVLVQTLNRFFRDLDLVSEVKPIQSSALKKYFLAHRDILSNGLEQLKTMVTMLRNCRTHITHSEKSEYHL